MSKKLKLSIVIPVLNEQDYIGPCLEAIARQTVMPDEVIVVDNNCTDQTVKLVKRFGFTKLVEAPRSGRAYAQTAGFKVANGDILARIDADTRLNQDWTEKTLAFFARHPEVAAVTGKSYFYDFPWRRLSSAVHYFVYHFLQRLIAGTDMLWASNMAIRVSAWQRVSSACQFDNRVAEDMDISMQLHKRGLKIARDSSLIAEVSMRRGDFDLFSINRYLQLLPTTYWRNGRRGQAAIAYLIKTFLLIFGTPAYIWHYGQRSRQFIAFTLTSLFALGRWNQ